MKMYEFKPDDAFAFARFVGIEAKQKDDELVFRTCPYCKPNPVRSNLKTFSINLKTGQFKCLRTGCGMQGNMITLSHDFDFSLGFETDEYYRPKKKYRTLPTPKEPVVPKDPALEYLKSRGIGEEVAKRYEITVQTEHQNVLVFPFYDENNVLQFVKYRKTDYDPKRDSDKEWCEKNCKPILFGMKQCNGSFDRLILTEGQLDTLAVAEAGVENAVSVPTGAKGFTWVPYCFNWVSQFTDLIVFGDYENGRISLLEEVQQRFPCHIKHVQEKDYQNCKDANELLQKFGKEAVVNAVDNAVPIPVKHVLSLADVENVNIYKLPKLKTGIKQLDYLLYGGLPFGCVCLIAGKRGDGKSTFASQIMANAIDQGYVTFAYSGEMPNHLYKSWLDFQIAGKNHIIENTSDYDGSVNRFISNSNQALINSWYQDKAFIYDSRLIETDEKENLLESVTKAIMQYGVKVVLIDNLMTAMYLDEVTGSDKYDQQGHFVRELTKIAIRYDVLIILVVHRRKNTYSDDANDEVSGSSDITNLAGITLSYDRGTQKEFDNGTMTEDQRKLIVSKNRLFGKVNLKGFVLDYDEKSKRIYGQGDDLNKQYGWDTQEWMSVDSDIPFD